MEGTLKDAQGTNDGRIIGPAGFGEGKVGQAFQFDSTANHVRVLKSSAIDVGGGDGLTIELWINPSVVSFQQPLLEWNDNQGNIGTHFWIAVELEGGGNGSLFASVIDTEGVSHQFSSNPGVIATKTFQHVALTYGKASGIARLFHNGQIVKEQSLGAFTPQTSYDLYLGERPSGTAAGNRFYGLMDEVSLYGRALDPTEILSIFDAGAAGKCTKPVIMAPPESHSAFVGQTTSFRVVASGSAPLSYQWSKDGVAIAGATNATLNLASVQLEDAGHYFVLVSNGVGVAMSPIVVLTVDPAGLPGSVVVPNAFATKEEDGQSGSLSQSIRVMDVYEASQFPKQPIVIKEIRLRRNAGEQPFTTIISDLRISLSTTKSRPDELNTTFADNVGSNVTEVFAGSIRLSSLGEGQIDGPNPFDMNIPCLVPFTYDPAEGNLLMEIRNYSGSAAPRNDASNDSNDGASRVFGYRIGVEMPSYAAYADTGADIVQFVYETQALNIKPAGGWFTNSVTVVLAGGPSGAEVRYTLDGTEPTAQGQLYQAPFILTTSAMLKARAFTNGVPASEAVAARFLSSDWNDGILPDWREKYFGQAFFSDPRAAALSDPDGDGLNNYEEAVAGTNPLAGDSWPAEWIVAPSVFTDKEDDGQSGVLTSEIRVMEVYAASHFPPKPVLIRQIRLRRDANVAPFTAEVGNLRIGLSTTKRTPGALSSTFAENIGADVMEVFSGRLLVSSLSAGQPGGPNPFDIVIPCTTPFNYDPAEGNLLLDIRNLSGSAVPRIDASNDTDDSASRIFGYGSGGGEVAVASFADSGADIVQFVWERPLIEITPDGGAFHRTVEVRISVSPPGGIIRYTLDGSEPTLASQAYGGVFELWQSAILKARLFVNGNPVSQVVSADFVLSPQPPSIIAPPLSQSVEVGDDVRFSVTAAGAEPLSYQWLWQGAAIAGATNRELVLRSVRQEQAGTYSVRVSNAGGETVSTSAALLVAPRELFVQVTDSEVVRGGGGFQGAGWADYDGDGDLDLYVCSLSEGGVLYRNEGGGVFTKTTGVLPIPTGESQSCAWGDYDNDGHVDLFVGSAYGLLFHNRGNGTFERITTGAIANDGGNLIGCGWADYDRDGFLDLFVADQGGKNRLYHNEGNGAFTRITAGEIVNDMANTVACAWGDYDNDGYPDLFVANVAFNDNALYHNERNGTFKKITNGAVVHDGGWSQACAWGDYDNDGWLDLFVANGSGKNFLYRNNGDGTFTRMTEGLIVNDAGNSYGAAWADYNNDGRLDLFVANEGANLLYRNNGDGTFEKITAAPTIAGSHMGYAAAWSDYDQDGFVDLFASDFSPANSQLYHNNGNGNAWITIGCEGFKSNRGGIGARVKVKTVVEGLERRQIREISTGDGWRDNGPYANFGLGSATVIDTVEVDWPSGAVQVLRNVAVNQRLLIKETSADLMIQPDDGDYNHVIEITMSTSVPQGVIRYTLDGGEPTPESTAYQKAIRLSHSASVKARVYVAGVPASEIRTATYAVTLTAPTIVSQPKSRTVALGDTVSFEVTAEGTPPMAYEWFYNQQPIANATNAVLTLFSVRTNDAGTYVVKVINPLGYYRSDPAILTVIPALIAPVIAKDLADQTVLEGSKALFEVVATGTEPLTYRWFRNTAPIEGASGPMLVITNVHPSDAGSYAVWVTNAVGTAASRTVVLTVTPIVVPPSIAVAPAHQWVGPGERAAFAVTLAGGTPPLTYQWRFNGKTILGADGATLTFTNATISDSGTYTVSVSNRAGSVFTDGAVLDVLDPATGGLLVFENHLPDYGIDAPVFDSDGVTRLGGPGFLAQLYGGTNGAAALVPAGAAVPFKTGIGAGYIQTGVTAKRVIPGVRPGDPATVQVRVWEAAKGASFEEAVAAGAKVGQSQRLTLTTGNFASGTPIPVLSGLTGFSIGLPRSLPAVVISYPLPGSVQDERLTPWGFITNVAPIVSARWEFDGQPMGALAVTNNRFTLPALLLHRGENRVRVLVVDAEGDEGVAEVAVLWEPLRTLSVIGGEELQEGKRLTFGVALTSQGDVGGLTFKLPYDAACLADPDFVWDTSVASATKSVNLALGEVTASLALSGTVFSTGTQTLGTVSFRARSVPARQAVSLGAEVLNVANGSGVKLLFGTDTVPGASTVVPRRIKGDNNANNLLDIGDGVLIQRMLTGLDEVRSWDVGYNDLNLSTDLDVGDVIKVLRAVVGIDPQPTVSAGLLSGLGQLAALQGESSSEASALLTVDKPTARSGEVVTVSVAFADISHSVAGAAFTVKYPVEAMRLLEEPTSQADSIVPSAASVMWNVKGGYAAQTGEATIGILNAASWPSANGVVAELKFRMQPRAASAAEWSIGLDGVVVTETGYDQESLVASGVGIQMIPPRVGGVVFKEGRLEFSLQGGAGSSCRIETSIDLEHWETVETVVNTTGDLRYLAPALPGSNVRFFRLRTE